MSHHSAHGPLDSMIKSTHPSANRATIVVAIVVSFVVTIASSAGAAPPQTGDASSGSSDAGSGEASGQDQDTQPMPMSGDEDKTEQTKPPEIVEDQLVRLDPDLRIWFDRVDKFVVVDGEVCLRQGQLEVFACPVGTKEHEAVVKVFSDAFHVHLALLRVGAIPGSPVVFDPMYKPADGMAIDVWVVWEDEEGESKFVRGQDWVRHSRTKEALDQEWVFGGSGFWIDEETGQRFYQAEGGELICLSNFSTATMDLPIESTATNADLLFEPFTERIPNRGTKLRLILKPRIPAKDDDQSSDDGDSDDGDSDDATNDGKGDNGSPSGKHVASK